MKQETALIRVTNQTKDILLRLKEHPKDSYDFVINVLISKCYNHPTPTLTSPTIQTTKENKPSPLPIKDVGGFDKRRNSLY